MDTRHSPHVDQRAGVRQITFALDNVGRLGPVITLPIRPEDLTRTEPTRVAVHQTLGRDVVGWADDFGEGLGSINIAGHTGWHTSSATGKDGVEAFLALHDLVQRQRPAAKQAAIDSGTDPAKVKLLYIDALNDFAWVVAPGPFVLRRSKSRPLLMQYQISMNAIANKIDNPPTITPPTLGNLNNALLSLDNATAGLGGSVIENLLKSLGIDPSIAKTIGDFVNTTKRVFQGVIDTVKFIQNTASQVVSKVIGVAREIANVGKLVFRAVSTVVGITNAARAELIRIGAAYNEVVCVFSNVLKPVAPYLEYSKLFGASNCSSTTGGRPPSVLAGQNVFALLNDATPSQITTVSAQASMDALRNMDPVLAPMSNAEISRHLGLIMSGVAI